MLANFKPVGNIEVKDFFSEKEIEIESGINHWCCNCARHKVSSGDSSTGRFLSISGPSYVKEDKSFSGDDVLIVIAICTNCIARTCTTGRE